MKKYKTNIPTHIAKNNSQDSFSLKHNNSNSRADANSLVQRNKAKKQKPKPKQVSPSSLKRSEKNYFVFKNDQEEDIFDGDQMIDSQIIEKKSNKLIHPHSRFKIIWNIIMSIFIIYIAIMMPFRFAFIQNRQIIGWIIFDFIVDLVFITDIVVNFFSSYHDKNNILVQDRVKIAKNYLKSWFIIDLISSFPLEFILKMIEDSNNILLIKLARIPRIYKLMRLIKLIRLYKSNKFMQRLLKKLHIKSQIKQIIKLFFILIFLIHSIACIWYLGAVLNTNYEETWAAEQTIQQDQTVKAYVASIYWAVQTITTVGFGDIVPQTPGQILISCAIFFIGVAIYTFMISKLANLFSTYNKERNFISQKLKAVENFIEQSHINEDLGQRMIYYFQKNTSRAFLASSYQIEDLKEDLPKNLSVQLALHIHRESINAIRFLQCRTKQFYTQILPNLKPVQMKKGSVVYQQGSSSQEVYFILEGEVRRDGRKRVYKKSTFFGETDIILNQRARKETLIVEQNAKLLTLDKTYFQQLMIRFADIRQQIKYITFNREYERLFHIHGEALDTTQLYQEISSAPLFSLNDQNPSNNNQAPLKNDNIHIQQQYEQQQQQQSQQLNQNQESKNFKSNQIRRSIQKKQRKPSLAKGKSYIIEKNDRADDNNKSKIQSERRESKLMKSNLGIIKNQPQMKDLRMFEKQMLHHEFDPSVAIQEHFQQIQNKLRQENIDYDKKEEEYNNIQAQKRDSVISIINPFEFKKIMSREESKDLSKAQSKELSKAQTKKSRVAGDNQLEEQPEVEEDIQRDQQYSPNNIKRQKKNKIRLSNNISESVDGEDDNDDDKKKQPLHKIVKIPTKSLQYSGKQSRSSKVITSSINSDNIQNYYEEITELQNKVQITNQMIDQAVIMVNNAKKLIGSFIELFNQSLKQNDGNYLFFFHFSIDQKSYIRDVIKSGMVGLQNYLLIINMIQQYLEQRKNSPFLVQLKELSIELQEVQKKQVLFSQLILISQPNKNSGVAQQPKEKMID